MDWRNQDSAKAPRNLLKLKNLQLCRKSMESEFLDGVKQLCA